MKLIDTLEGHGLVSSDSIKRLVFELPFKTIESVREEIEQAVRSDIPEIPNDGADHFNSFNFLASASFRGESGCAHWECRLKKGEILARYAALFCDRVIVPFRFNSTTHNASQRDQRSALATTLLLLSEFRPLLDCRVIIPVPSDVHYCETHFASEVPGGERILATQRELTDSLYSKFKMTYLPGSRGKHALSVTGPEEFLEHGHMTYMLKASPRWLSDLGRSGSSYDLAPEEIRKSGVVDSLISRMTMDVAIQQVFGCRFGCSYLTDRAGEASFLTRINEQDSLAARTAVLCAELAHSIPLFMDVPLTRVMKIRREDYAAFASYRAALAKIVSENICGGKELTSKEAKELFRDFLEPEVLSLEQQAKNERKYSRQSSALKLGLVAGTVALGAYTGLLPAHLPEWYRAVGGAALGTGLAEVVMSMAKNPAKIRSHNLYFLLRLKQEGD